MSSASKDRRRRLRGFSRDTETPRHLVIELNADANDYLVRTDAAGEVRVTPWQAVIRILWGTSHRLTQDQIMERWPEGDRPDRTTLYRWLTRASRQNVVRRIGTGDRGNPFRYWLPGHEPLLWPGDGSFEEQEAWRKLRHEFPNGRYTPPTVGLDA